VSLYKHLSPEEAAGAAVGFLTRSLPIPGELQEYISELGIGHIFDDECDMTQAEQELAAMGVEA
jgi:hypothetical protein